MDKAIALQLAAETAVDTENDSAVPGYPFGLELRRCPMGLASLAAAALLAVAG